MSYKKVRLPKKINIRTLSTISNKIETIKHCKNIEFDMSNTTYVHVSFIGYLLNLKNKIDKQEKKLILNFSKELKILLKSLNVLDFFLFGR
jgi:hypothetical protein